MPLSYRHISMKAISTGSLRRTDFTLELRSVALELLVALLAVREVQERAVGLLDGTGERGFVSTWDHHADVCDV